MDKEQYLQQQVDRAYWERNQLVAFLSRLYPSWSAPATDTDPGEYWHVVYVESPAGQLSWHVHESEMGHFQHLDGNEPGTWDGHTTEEKYDRLRAITGHIINGYLLAHVND